MIDAFGQSRRNAFVCVCMHVCGEMLICSKKNMLAKFIFGLAEVSVEG